MSFFNLDLRLSVPTVSLAVLLLFSSQLSAGAFEQLFAPKAELWDTWQTHRDDNQSEIDHSAWGRFLGQYVKQGAENINLVDYSSVSKPDRQALQDYISSMQAVTIRDYSRNQQMAYWINLYNALTVRVILDHYPVESIRDIDISPGFFSDGPWAKKLLTIEGEAVSLDDIEHRILRPIWKDARIHYAVNCASIGCPNLQPKPFLAATLNTQLDEAAREYVNHPRAVRVTGTDLYVSSIYSWFQVDFGETEADVIQHMKRYASSSLSSQLDGIEFFTDDNYDWTLNDVSKAAP